MDDYNALVVKQNYNLLTAISNFEKQKKAIEEQEAALRENLHKAMEEQGVWDIDFLEGDLKITRIPATTQTRIDTARLKEELPVVAEEYSKTVDVKGSVRITLTKDKKK